MRVLIVLLIFLPGSIHAQGYFLGFGYGGFAGKYANINYSIDRYNQTRTYLDKQMKNITFPRGLALHGAYFGSNIYFDMNLTGRRAYSSAYGIDQSGKLMQRDLRLKTFSIGANLGIGAFPVYFCSGLEAGLNTISSRVDQRNKVENQKFERINRDPYVALPLFLTYILPFDKEDKESLGLQFKTGMHFSLVQSDVTKMNEAINRATYMNDPEDLLKSKNHSFEISIILGFYGTE